MPPSAPSPAWQLLTRLGEIQIMLPAMAVAAWSIRRNAPRLAGRWVAGMAAAIALTTATKIAFIGWGWGAAALDFTGVSGHALMASGVLPLLLMLALPAAVDRFRVVGLGTGTILALAVALSRIVLGAHSWSEVVAGVALGTAVSATALATGTLPRIRLPAALAYALLAALVIAPATAPASRTHDVVTRIALALSGRPHPYTRWQMRREYRQQRSGHASNQASGTSGGRRSKPVCSIT